MQFPSNFYDWLDFWLEYYHKPKVKQSTYQSTYYKINMLKKHANNIELDLVDEFYCQGILNRMYDAKYAKDTIIKIRTILIQSLKQAKRKNCINENPTEELIIPKAHTKVVEALTTDEQIKVENACKKMPYGYLFIFLLNTGLRRSELANLKWSDFDKKNREIAICKSKTKNGIRTIPLVNVAYNIILSQRKVEKSNYIFHSPQGGCITPTFMKRLYNDIRQSTGINTFTNHVCRHTFATRLIEYGASPKSVAALLGHSKVEYALNIYTNLEKRHVRKEIFLLELHTNKS